MKRIFFLTIAMCCVLGVNCQQKDTCGGGGNGNFSVIVGVKAGLTLYGNQTELSPFHSNLGVFLNVPLTANFKLSDKWLLVTGLQLNVHCDPLVYNIKEYDDGIDFQSLPATGHQSAMVMHGYIGIPFVVKYRPWIDKSRPSRDLLSFAFDIYAGYAFKRGVNMTTSNAYRDLNGSVVLDNRSARGLANGGSGWIMPWKLELGVSVSTDVLGLAHGVRFWADLLPTFHDKISDSYIHTIGMSFYL